MPSGCKIVVLQAPIITYPHSAAFACQCISRILPGAKRIETPAMPIDAGKSVTEAPLVIPPSLVRGAFFSNSYLKLKFGFAIILMFFELINN